MANKKSTGRAQSISESTGKPERPPLINILLALTLVPLIAGVVFIAAWALDIRIWQDLQQQIVIGTFFILLSFAASNLLQQKWLLGVGWSLICLASLLLWVTNEPRLLIFTYILGGLGILLVGYQYFRRIAQQGQAQKSR